MLCSSFLPVHLATTESQQRTGMETLSFPYRNPGFLHTRITYMESIINLAARIVFAARITLGCAFSTVPVVSCSHTRTDTAIKARQIYSSYVCVDRLVDATQVCFRA